MERVRLNAELAERAETYLPLAVKSALAQVLAPGCMEKTKSGRWQENIIGRKLVETYVLAGYYLHLIDVSELDKPEPKFDLTLEQYDELSGLEDDLLLSCSTKGTDIKNDFLDFKEILGAEINNRMAEYNDPLNRLGEALAAGLTPELRKTVLEITAPDGMTPEEFHALWKSVEKEKNA